jgi:hypothetical protein
MPFADHSYTSFREEKSSMFPVNSLQSPQEVVYPRLREVELKKSQEHAEPEQRKKPMPEPPPKEKKPVSTAETTDLFAPVLIIGVVLLAGVVIFLLLRRKGANRQ